MHEEHSVTTSAKIKAITTAMLAEFEERIKKQDILPVVQKVDQHDSTIGFLRRLLGGRIKKGKSQV